MNVSIPRQLCAAAIFLAAAASPAFAQAVTVTGHVTSNGAPLVGAHVRLETLHIDRVTDVEGRYSFVVPSADVRGQTVRITASISARGVRYAPKSASIALSGGAITQDFDLERISGNSAAANAAAGSDTTEAAGQGPAILSAGGAGDTLDLTELAGAVDLPSALAGRLPGVAISSSAALGGSSSFIYRGPRSLAGTSQPLYVIDGIPVDNTVFTSTAQRYGAGGFDYGSPIGDLNLADIASVRWVTGADATARYGGRAANGVIVITTKDGSTGKGFAISASQQITSESPARLPSFQNQYGQGLDGAFEFFDGRGGGINDAVAESWGPKLDGRPLAQASLTQAGQPDVRLWTAQPNNVSDYFDAGRTTNTNVAVQGHAGFGSLRASVGQRLTDGLTPTSSLLRRDGALRFTLKPVDRLNVGGNVAVAETRNSGAPGTGFDQGNPVSQFTLMGRQVDVDALQSHLRDPAGQQISWNYAGQNNPYFAPLENSNRSDRNHVTGGASASYEVAPGITASARAGSDYYRDGRLFTIASGWMGGFPFFAGPGDFSKGGSEGDELYAQETNAAIRLDGVKVRPDSTRWAFAAGADLSATRQRIRTAGVDSAADLPSVGAPDTAAIPLAVQWSAHARTTGVFAEGGWAYADRGQVGATIRQEWSSIVPGQHASALYPSLQGSLNLLPRRTTPRTGALASATLDAQWWRAGNDLTPYEIETIYAGRPVTGAIAPVGQSLVTPDRDLKPEITNGWQLGANLGFLEHALGLGVTYYDEKTSDVMLPVRSTVLQTVTATNAGVISNRGVEAMLSARVGDGQQGLGWNFSASVAKNANEVERLYDDTKALALGPAQWGVTTEAVTGQPLGVLTGMKFLRDPKTHALLLMNGLPLPDSVAGPQQLGTAQPKWILGARSTLRYRWASLTLVADAHLGGSFFSSTNLWGDYAGNFAETAYRPDSGLLITGIDATTGTANTQHVSTQAYYHALGAIQEPWVYSASFVKLREARLSVSIPTTMISMLPFESAVLSFVAQNPYLWSKVKNVDPEVLLSPYQYPGMELGQLPTTRSIGFQLTVVP